MAMLPQASNPGLLFIIGADREEHLVRTGDKIRIRGSSEVYKLLGTGVPFHRIQITPQTLRQKARPSIHYWK